MRRWPLWFLPALALPEVPALAYPGALPVGLLHPLGTDDLGRDGALRLALAVVRSFGFASACALLALALALLLVLHGRPLRPAQSALRAAPPLLWLIPLAALTGRLGGLGLGLLIAALFALHLAPPLEASLAPTLRGPAWAAGRALGAPPLHRLRTWAPWFAGRLDRLFPTAWLGCLWAEATLGAVGLGAGPERDCLGQLLLEEVPRLSTDPTPLGWTAMALLLALAWGSTAFREAP